MPPTPLRLKATCLSIHWVTVVRYSDSSDYPLLSAKFNHVTQYLHISVPAISATRSHPKCHPVSTLPPRLLQLPRSPSPGRGLTFHDWPTHSDCFLSGEAGIGVSFSCSQPTLTERLAQRLTWCLKHKNVSGKILALSGQCMMEGCKGSLGAGRVY